MENKKTGYPHIDKPWMKYYEGRDIPEIVPAKNLVEVLKDRNKTRMVDPAYEYYRKLTSYDEMFYNIDNASRVLSELGVKEKDIIISLVPNIPEEEHLLYGANQIGASIDYFDPMPGMDPVVSARKLFETIKHEKENAEKIGYNMNYVIAFDMCYLALLAPIENDLKEIGIDNVILLDTASNMDENQMFNYMKTMIDFERLRRGEKLVDSDITVSELKLISSRLKSTDEMNMFLNNMIKSSPLNIYKYNDLLRECKTSRIEVVNKPDLIASIGHTSGTSGAFPKPISLTHKQVISSMMECDIGGVGAKEGETVLHALPGFAHAGRQNNGTLTYYSRGINIHVPEFPMEHYAYMVKTLKPNVIMGPSAFSLSLMSKDYMKDEDLSFITKIFYGGDPMSAENEERLNEFLKEHNCRASMHQAYGLSETAGAAAYAKDDYKRPDSIGIPLPRTIISVVDPNVKDRLVPLKMKEGMERLEGEIVISCDMLTDGLIADPGKIKFQTMENDGRRYLRTGDAGYMDKDGIFFLKGRMDRGFIRYDGYNYRPYEVEPEILSNEYVKEVQIVPYYDESKSGIMPFCHIVLNNKNVSEEEQIKIVEDIVHGTIIANPKMDLRQIPSKFKIRESMPRGKMNKINFKALEAEGLTGDEINVIVDQTNVKAGGIEIFKDEKGRARKLSK